LPSFLEFTYFTHLIAFAHLLLLLLTADGQRPSRGGGGVDRRRLAANKSPPRRRPVGTLLPAAAQRGLASENGNWNGNFLKKTKVQFIRKKHMFA
jgi:hypothetical protein